LEEVMFEAFHTRFPDVGVTETRTITPELVAGQGDTYIFLELYCNDERCDCRRVIVHVCSLGQAEEGSSRPLASLSFGWEPEQFYRDWAGFPLDADDLAELKGPGLQRLVPQTALADLMLEWFRDLLADPDYVARIKRHYQAFRASVGKRDPEARAQRRAELAAKRRERRRRR